MRISTFILLFLVVAVCTAQDVRINGNSGEPSVFQSTNTSTSYTDRPGVYGISEPQPGYGIGVRGDGSWMGVYGVGAGPTGTGVRIGTAGVSNGGYQNWGLYGSAPTSSGSYAAVLSGNMLVFGTITTMSDARLKTNITAMTPALTKIMSLKPKTYQMLASAAGIEDNSLPQGTQDGLIAQDVQTVFPELVTDVPLLNPMKKNKPSVSYKGVNYVGLVPVLIKALQEQQDQITVLQQQVQALSGNGKNK